MYKVLIVDDEAFIRRGLEHCMDWEAYECSLVGSAVNGLDALGKIKYLRPDIVISDINMEQMTGLELVEQLNREYPTIKCILLTGIYEFNSVYGAIKYNVVDLILKPTSPSRVQKAVSKAIRLIEVENMDRKMREQMALQDSQNRRLKHAMLLSNILDGHTPPNEVVEALHNVGLVLTNFSVITVLLWGVSEQSASASFYEIEKMIYSCADQIFEEVPYYCVFTSGHSIHFVIDYGSFPQDPLLAAKQLCTDLYRTIDNLSDYNSTIGIGRFYSNVTLLPRAAKESIKAANYALYDKETVPVICAEHMPTISTNTILDIKAHIDKLYDAIGTTDQVAANQVLSTLAQYYIDQKLSIDEVRNISAIVANLCIRHLWDHSLLENPVFSTDHVFYKGIMKSAHMEELYTLSVKIVDLTIHNLSSIIKEPRNLMEQVENYIRKNIREDLSLTRIADIFHISSSYLSRLYKLKRNSNLSTFIQNVRIEKAKELISTTELRTYEIAEQVGIYDPVYFSKLFKRATGMRVRDYREQRQAAVPHV